MHLIRIATVEIAHETPQGVIATPHPIGIDNMCAVAEIQAGLLVHAVEHVHTLPSPHHVVLGNNDDIRVAQLAEVFTGLERVRIHQRGIVPRTLRLGALVGTLYLDVVFPALRISREHVEPDAASLKALDRILGLRLDHLQVLLADDDLQDKLDALRRVLKAFRHEGVVHEPEVLDQRKVLRLHDVRRAPRPLLAEGGRFAPARMYCLLHIVSFRPRTPCP